MSAPNQLQTRSLLRSLIRHTSKITNYNFRSHAMRRVKAGFAANRTASGAELSLLYTFGLKQLDIAKRQSLVSQLYPDTMSSVMQTPKVRALSTPTGKIAPHGLHNWYIFGGNIRWNITIDRGSIIDHGCTIRQERLSDPMNNVMVQKWLDILKIVSFRYVNQLVLFSCNVKK